MGKLDFNKIYVLNSSQMLSLKYMCSILVYSIPFKLNVFKEIDEAEWNSSCIALFLKISENIKLCQADDKVFKLSTKLWRLDWRMLLKYNADDLSFGFCHYCLHQNFVLLSKTTLNFIFHNLILTQSTALRGEVSISLLYVSSQIMPTRMQSCFTQFPLSVYLYAQEIDVGNSYLVKVFNNLCWRLGLADKTL